MGLSKKIHYLRILSLIKNADNSMCISFGMIGLLQSLLPVIKFINLTISFDTTRTNMTEFVPETRST